MIYSQMGSIILRTTQTFALLSIPSMAIHAVFVLSGPFVEPGNLEQVARNACPRAPINPFNVFLAESAARALKALPPKPEAVLAHLS